MILYNIPIKIERVALPIKSATKTIYSSVKNSSNIHKKLPSVKNILDALQYHIVTSLIGRFLSLSFFQTVVAKALKKSAIQNFPTIAYLSAKKFKNNHKIETKIKRTRNEKFISNSSIGKYAF